ncbi:MAG: hypothetical protein MUO76_15165 [Anaerolineaceae bacterium]|nr:hypothetical protein [Anaerolineaceae bacterium]
MTELEVKTIIFQKPGKINTDRTLELAIARAADLGLKKVLVATTSGETGARTAELFQDYDVVAVSHVTGFREPNVQELTPENRMIIESSGGIILTAQHALGGLNRAVRNKFGTYQLDEIIAHTFRLFGQGMKVVVEIALMAADAGLARTDEPAMCIAGTGRGADTAAIVYPANAHSFFDLSIPEIICRPAAKHPGF